MKIKTADKKLQPGAYKQRTRGQEIFRQFRKNKGAVIAAAVLVVMFAIMIFAQIYYDYDTDIVGITTNVLAKPSWEHPMGTDQLGRDVLARLLYGGRWSISLALISVFVSAVVGIVYGAIATYIGGTVETIMMRIIEAIMMLPSILLVIVLVGVLGTSVPNLIIAMSIGGIPHLARLTRSAIMPIRNSDYVEAARAIGVSDARILFTHILPNCISPMIVSITMRVGGAIVSIASCSFLGVGVPKPMPEWGTMLSEARGFMQVRPDLIFYPGIMILLFALAFSLLGDGLRDALDPKLKR